MNKKLKGGFLSLLVMVSFSLTLLAGCNNSNNQGSASGSSNTFVADTNDGGIPLNTDQPVSVNPLIVIKFNEPVKPETMNNNVTLVDGKGNNVAISAITPTDETYTTYAITPESKLDENTHYTLSVSNHVQSANGTFVQSQNANFATAGSEMAPAVAMLKPRNNATNIARRPIVTLMFSEAVENVNSTTITIRRGSEAGPIVAAYSVLKKSSTTYDVMFNQDLADTTKYFVILSNQIYSVSDYDLERTVFNFTTGDFTAPLATLVSPTNNATNVNTTPVISVRFNEAVKNVTTSSFTVREGSESGALVPVSQVLQSANNTYTLTLTDKLKNTKVYYIMLSDQITDMSNNKLVPVNYVFTTGNFNKPEVAEMSPSDGESGVSTNPIIEFELTDGATNVNKDTVELRKESADGELVAITDIIDNGDGTYSFTAESELEDNTTYYIIFTDEIIDENGNKMDPKVIEFTTGDHNDPTVAVLTPHNNESGVQLMPTISLRFSEKMQHVNTTNVKLYKLDPNNEANKVSITNPILGANNIYSFTPSANLDDSAMYYIVIESAIVDLANKPLLNRVVTHFTTADKTAPTVTMLTPSNNAESVSTTPSIVFVFNEAVESVNTANIKLHAINESGATVTISNITQTNNEYQAVLASKLADNTTYYLVFGNGIKDLEQNRLTRTVKTFTTGNFNKPEIGATSPSNNESNVTTTPIITFNVSEDVTNVNQTTVQLREGGPNGPIVQTNSIIETSPGNYSIVPSGPLKDNTTYYVVFTDQLVDDAGNKMDTTNIIFTTGNYNAPQVAVTAPINNSINIDTAITMSIQFSESVTGVDTTSVKLYRNSISSEANRVSLHPLIAASQNVYYMNAISPLAEQTEYFIVVESSIKDLGNNRMTTRVVSKFTTGDFTKPTVNMVSPQNNTPFTYAGDAPSIRFSEKVVNVDASTFTMHYGYESGPIVPATVEDIFPTSLNGSHTSFWLLPDNDLITGDYYIVLTNDITDFAGNRLERTVFRSSYAGF